MFQSVNEKEKGVREGYTFYFKECVSEVVHTILHTKYWLKKKKTTQSHGHAYCRDAG